VDYLYPVQRFVISNVLEGRGQIVVLPTGAGKSMCFQLPGLFLPGPTLVLLPLLSLMSDQQRRLARTGIPAGCLRGGLTPEQKNRLFAEIRSGRLRIILATPESCLVPSNLRALQACRVSHLVVDEAHCICEWGDSFRPAYRAVGDVCRQLCVPVVSAFTATASPPVIDRIRGALFAGREARVVAGSADRPNIGYAVVPLLSRGRALVELARNAVKPLLVFCRTRSGVEVGARIIHRRFPDVGVRFYHAGLDREERAGVESWFLRSTDGVLVATCAYGLGVDKPDIRTVAHADVPPSVEAYLQESGRAGRDGRASTALLMVSPDDAAFLSRLPEGVARDRFAGMLRYALGAGCRRNALLGMIGQAPVACSGCDWCSGRSCLAASGESEILRFVRRHAGRFDVPQAATILCAGVGPRQKRDYYDCIFGFGALEGWERADVEECLHSLVASGRLRLDGRGLIYQTVAPGTPL
jgi:ATP-dependent DNA helicase RecQ